MLVEYFFVSSYLRYHFQCSLEFKYLSLEPIFFTIFLNYEYDNDFSSIKA